MKASLPLQLPLFSVPLPIQQGEWLIIRTFERGITVEFAALDGAVNGFVRTGRAHRRSE